MSKDTIETDDKRLALRVFGLTEGELAALREIACKEYGKPRVSLLAKKYAQSSVGCTGRTRTGQTSTAHRQQAHYSPPSRKRPCLPRSRRRKAQKQRERHHTRYSPVARPQTSPADGGRSQSAFPVKLPAFKYRPQPQPNRPTTQ